MGTGQREAGLRMIENGAQPIGRRVAKRAIPRKSRGHVVRIGGPIELRQVASLALGRRIGELAARVALRAGGGGVGSREREADSRVVER